MVMSDPVTDKESGAASFRRVSKLEPDERGDFHVQIVRSDI
jgi:hypothetical protein